MYSMVVGGARSTMAKGVQGRRGERALGSQRSAGHCPRVRAQIRNAPSLRYSIYVVLSFGSVLCDAVLMFC